MSNAPGTHAPGRGLAAWRDAWVRVGVVLALATPAFFVLAAFGVKYQLFSWDFGFRMLAMRVLPSLATIAVAAGLVGLVLAFVVKPMRLWRVSALFLLPPIATLAVWGVTAGAGLRAPPVHDVSTDLQNPPGFSPLVAAERAMASGANGLDLKNARVPETAEAGAAAGLRVTAVLQSAYPDLEPIATGAAPSRALAAARGACVRLGWMIDRVDERAGAVEARDVDFWFGVVTDIAVRVTAANPGSVVDIRSVSRIGEADFGANARRVRAFRTALTQELTR